MEKTLHDMSLQVLSVYLGEHIFGIPIMEIRDVLKPLQLTHVPLARNIIAGTANLRGRIVTAIDLRRSLEIPHDQNETTVSKCMNVVIEADGELFSLLVDRVGDVLTLEPKDIDEPPMTLDSAWCEVALGVHQLKQALMIILNTEKIIHVS